MHWRMGQRTLSSPSWGPQDPHLLHQIYYAIPALLGGEKGLKQSRAGKRWRDGPVSFPWKMTALSPLLDATAQSMEKRKKERKQLHMGLRRGINNAGWGLLTGSDCIGA